MTNRSTATTASATARGVWSQDEHDRFLEALQLYPNGPWKCVADFVGTRTVRQVQTHAQMYHERAARRLRDLRQDRERYSKSEPSIESEMKHICEVLQRNRVALSPRSAELQQRSVERLGKASSRYFRQLSLGTDAEMASTLDDDDSTPSFEECIDFLIEVLESSARTSESDGGSP